jgi:fructose-specific phosphotransferase system IIC component
VLPAPHLAQIGLVALDLKFLVLGWVTSLSEADRPALAPPGVTLVQPEAYCSGVTGADAVQAGTAVRVPLPRYFPQA